MLSNLVPDTFPASAPVAPVSAPIRPGFECLQWNDAGNNESPAEYRGRLEFRRNVCARTVVDFVRSVARGGPAYPELLAIALRDFDRADIEYRALLGFDAREA